MAAGPLDQGLDTFKSLVWDSMIDKVVGSITGLSAVLAWGPIAFIVSVGVSFIATKIYDALKLTIDLQYVMLLNEEHHKAFVAANLELRKIAKLKGINSPEFKEARLERRKALATFARYVST